MEYLFLLNFFLLCLFSLRHCYFSFLLCSHPPTGCPVELRTFESIEDGRRLPVGSTIMIPTPVFPKIDTTISKSDVASNVVPAQVSVAAVESSVDFSTLSLSDLTTLITETGNEIRILKGQKADKLVIKASVDKLLALKERYVHDLL